MSDVNIQVSQEVITSIIEKKIQTAVCTALHGETNLLEALVKTVLQVKVTSDGNVDRYSRSDSVDYIEYLCRKAIKEQAELGIRKFMEENSEVIQAEIVKQFKAQTRGLASQFVESLLNSAKESWKIRAELKLEKP